MPAWRLALRRSDLDATAKLVGLILSTYMDGAGRAQVSRSTIAAGCGLRSIDAVKRAVRRLEDAELLGVDRVFSGDHTPNRYQARTGGPPAPGRAADRGLGSTPRGGWNGGVPGAGEHRELEVLEVQPRARGREGQERGDEIGPEGLTRAEIVELARAARQALLEGET